MILKIGTDFNGLKDCLHLDFDIKSNANDTATINSSLMIPHNDNTFESVWVSDIFESISSENLAYFFRELRRVLMPNGHLIIHFNGYCNGIPLDPEKLLYFSTFSGLKKIGHAESILDTMQFNLQVQIENLHTFSKPDRQIRSAPLVSILMTVFHSEFFTAALESAVSQTYSNIEIIIGDDSGKNEIESIVRSFDFKGIPYTYIKNKSRLRERKNIFNVFNQCNGDYIKFLNHDDLIYPTCIEKMEPILSKYPDITLVSSSRHCIDKDSKMIGLFPIPISMTSDTILYGDLVVNLIAKKMNFIGEPTTTLFRKESVLNIQPDFISINQKHPKRGTPGDILIWINLMGQGKCFL